MKQRNNHLIVKVLAIGALIAVSSYLFHPGAGRLSVLLNGVPVSGPFIQFAALPTFCLILVFTGILTLLLFFGAGLFLFFCALWIAFLGVFLVAPYFWPVLAIILLTIMLSSIGNGRKD